MEPVRGSFNGYNIYSLGLPVLTGLGMVEAMQIASAAGLESSDRYDRDPVTLFKLLQIAKIGIMLNGPGRATQLGQQLQIDLSPPSRQLQTTSNALWSAVSAGKVPMIGALPPAPEHTDAIVVVDKQGNAAAVVHTINTVNWGSTGIFVNGVSIPDSATFQQRVIASLEPGSRLPATTHPGVALKDGKVAVAFGSTGSGSSTRSIAALLSVLGHGMTPQQAIDAPALGGFEFAPGPPSELTAIVGEGEFSEAYLESLGELGQAAKPQNSGRGYWLGVSIDPESGVRHAGVLREFPQLGGGGIGY
jgi:gamma-glutamyltranspeptidase/glutathione hydrolase